MVEAVLRKPGRLVLIDAEGHELEPISAQQAKGKLRRLTRIVQAIEQRSPHAPLLIGGDFNAPAGDAVFRLLKPLCLLTDKPLMYIANVAETGFTNNPLLKQVEDIAAAEHTVAVPVSAATMLSRQTS